MNKSKLKSYAPAARRDFIRAVTERANLLGLSEKKTEPVEEKGDVAIIAGRAWPIKVAAQRKGLDLRIEREGFAQVMEAVAYTWFNRFLALRYMELHDYLEHGFRVLSHPGESHIPEILEQAAKLDLAGLDNKKVIELKLDGNKDAELYRMLLIAQCNALHKAMPFLFEKIDDETEVLLPENLLHSDSLVRKLVAEIDEEDWQQVEIIGWLYQFYISEKKDQVIGKVVKPEDIPAATQLFTPNWIVKYMVQNSLGRKWLMTYPDSKIKEKMEYYIEPAEQTEEVKAQLAAVTPKELNPEAITLLDPASGSGHILVEAYDLFKGIYLERGYRSRDIPRLILEKNLYGLDIDDRAAQMTGFALLMKARADDRSILRENPPRLNVMAIQGSEGIDADGIANALLKEKTYSIVDGPSTLFPETISQPVLTATERSEIGKNDIKDLIELFKLGKNFGSLIQVLEKITIKLNAMANLVERNINSSDIFTRKAANTLLPFVRQAMVLAGKYNCVVANPPYMGSKGMNPVLKEFANRYFPDSKSDLFAMFIERGFSLCKVTGFNSMVTMQSWMFLSTYEGIRKKILEEKTIMTMSHLGARAFGEISGEVVQTTTFVFLNKYLIKYKPSFLRLVEGQEEDKRIALLNRYKLFNNTTQDDFKKIPGSPIAYWVSDNVRNAFSRFTLLGSIASPRSGMTTGNNDLFVRLWNEVSINKIGFNFPTENEANESEYKWFPYNKGGAFKQWYGNNDYVVNWYKSGQAILAYGRAFPRSRSLYFQPGLTWTDISSSSFGIRFFDKGFLFDASGPSLFHNDPKVILCFLASSVAFYFLKILNPTLHFQAGNIASLPVAINNNQSQKSSMEEIATNCIDIAKNDDSTFETSWNYQSFSWLTVPLKAITLEVSWHNWQYHCTAQIKRMQELETENNRIFIDAYGLQDELTPEVPEDQITLARANRETDMKRLISYAVGCMMGRYSLDHPGLIYANSGGVGFNKSKFKTFPADDDGIIPVMDMDWFEDDAASRFEEFLQVAWSPETLEENLKFVADSLSPKNGETPHETIRRYFSTQFYKDHMQTYKKRPIYWLFSSGKLKGFECLVYLHRYNESTLSRMRNEYVTPLQGKFTARADYLQNEINSAASASERTKLQKQLDMLRKKQAELKSFDDELRHYADQRIKLDLDDGVKVNYGKFGNLLAEVETITGIKT